jgi:hypothetical protein
MPKERKLQPRQHQQQQSGWEYKMRPRPKAQDERYRASEKLRDKEIAPSYVFLASDDSSYMTRQILHPKPAVL